MPRGMTKVSGKNLRGCEQTKNRPVPAGSQNGRVEKDTQLRNGRSCESTMVTRTKSGTYVSRRADGNAGAELLGNRREPTGKMSFGKLDQGQRQGLIFTKKARIVEQPRLERVNDGAGVAYIPK